jgi:hypothetical protein
VHDNASHEVISRIESPTLQRAASSRFRVAETRQVLSTVQTDYIGSKTDRPHG